MEGNRITQRKPTSFGRVLTNSSNPRSAVRYMARTHDLSGGRTSRVEFSVNSSVSSSVFTSNVQNLSFDMVDQSLCTFLTCLRPSVSIRLALFFSTLLAALIVQSRYRHVSVPIFIIIIIIIIIIITLYLNQQVFEKVNLKIIPIIQIT